MFRSLLLAPCFFLAFSCGAWAASDDEIAQKCISGMKTVAPNGAQITYLSGGNLNGMIHAGPSANVGIHGTWEVKNGVLNFRSQVESGQVREGSFPVRMDDAGNCYMTAGGTEKPIQK